MEAVIHYSHRHAERNKTTDNDTTKSSSKNGVCNVQSNYYEQHRPDILFLDES